MIFFQKDLKFYMHIWEELLRLMAIVITTVMD